MAKVDLRSTNKRNVAASKKESKQRRQVRPKLSAKTLAFLEKVADQKNVPESWWEATDDPTRAEADDPRREG